MCNLSEGVVATARLTCLKALIKKLKLNFPLLNQGVGGLLFFPCRNIKSVLLQSGHILLRQERCTRLTRTLQEN